MSRTGDLVAAGAERLRAVAAETPRLDAELLLAHAIGVDRTAVVAHSDAPVGPSAESTYLAFLARREAGEPVAFIRGFKEFHGIVIGVDSRALIPRPETEELVDLALREVMTRLTGGTGRVATDPVGKVRIIDVGTGSGAIAVALAVALRARNVPADELDVVAVDISPDALDLARENAVGHGVGDRISFIGADPLPPVSSSTPWDVIVANLPYVRSDALPDLPVAMSFEPVAALDGGPDGLAIIGRLFERLPSSMAMDGVAFVEIGADEGESVVKLAAERLPGWSCTVQTDLAGLPRTAILRRSAG
ncbi:MAG: peptide chain release factor N(5)-glutamine methyltransferase [Candidatus Limnocylindrales bacterium]